MRHLISLILLLAFALGVNAQDPATVFGKIKDTDGDPLTGVNIYLIGQENYGTVTGDRGQFSFEVPSKKKVYVVLRYLGYKNDTIRLQLSKGEQYELNYKFSSGDVTIPIVEIEDKKTREEASTVKIQIDAVEVAPNPSGNIESILQSQALGVSKNNELTSSYSVRGGNFDENLVYVNDFEVYRPFLIRSGQQEGLSFVNSDLASSVTFSSGGFQPKYGDKMSSVLDVEYKRPKEFGGSAQISLLGGSMHLEGTSKGKNFTYLVGSRYKTSKYLLGGLETTGEYSPSFVDVQSFFTFDLTDNTSIEVISNYARNRFSYTPIDRTTTFGVVNNVLRLTVFFEGSELDTYDSFMGGLALVNKPNNDLRIKWLVSGYKTMETEAFDIIGEYWLDEVESDFSDDNFGNTRFSLGAGGIQEYTRNRLEANIFSAGHKGYLDKGRHYVQWGVDYKNEQITDVINEWERLDSAGYALPHSNEEVMIDRVLKSNYSQQTNRFSAYFQDTWELTDSSKLSLTYGLRMNYWDLNQEFFITPRLQLAFRPNVNRDVVFRAAAGMYYQPPFYREMRDLDGVVHTGLRAQQSYHFVLGSDVNFQMWGGRQFKFVSEVYYKYLDKLVPYEFDNVLIRYQGKNSGQGYAWGIDTRLHGEFVRGSDSYISLSVMQTQEDILDDVAILYYDAEGNRVVPTRNTKDDIVDTVVTSPGFIPRPTDQRVSFALFFQDYLPRNENFKMHLNLVFGSGLPFGPPDNERYGDTLRIPFYRRVDIGFSASLYDVARKKKTPTGFMKGINSIWLTAEVFNLLGVSNTISYFWVKDVTNRTYAVPNHLTSRRINARLIVKF